MEGDHEPGDHAGLRRDDLVEGGAEIVQRGLQVHGILARPDLNFEQQRRGFLKGLFRELLHVIGRGNREVLAVVDSTADGFHVQLEGDHERSAKTDVLLRAGNVRLVRRTQTLNFGDDGIGECASLAVLVGPHLQGHAEKAVIVFRHLFLIGLPALVESDVDGSSFAIAHNLESDGVAFVVAGDGAHGLVCGRDAHVVDLVDDIAGFELTGARAFGGIIGDDDRRVPVRHLEDFRLIRRQAADDGRQARIAPGRRAVVQVSRDFLD